MTPEMAVSLRMHVDDCLRGKRVDVKAWIYSTEEENSIETEKLVRENPF